MKKLITILTLVLITTFVNAQSYNRENLRNKKEGVSLLVDMNANPQVRGLGGRLFLHKQRFSVYGYVGFSKGQVINKISNQTLTIDEYGNVIKNSPVVTVTTNNTYHIYNFGIAYDITTKEDKCNVRGFIGVGSTTTKVNVDVSVGGISQNVNGEGQRANFNGGLLFEFGETGFTTSVSFNTNPRTLNVGFGIRI